MKTNDSEKVLDKILCPYCGYLQEPTIKALQGKDYENHEYTCVKCKGVFHLDRVTVTCHQFVSHPVTEQRYYVRLPQPFYDNNESSKVMSLLNASGYFDTVKEYIACSYYKLTMEQIKKIDSRYLAFAIPVEQVEKRYYID